MKLEPVAWRYAISHSVEGPLWIYVEKDPAEWREPQMADALIDPLYPASALEAVRRQALEEAAKVCGELRHHNWSSESDDWIAGTDHCADAIRALINKENSSEVGSGHRDNPGA